MKHKAQRGTSKPRLTRGQRVAYHEAAHAVAALHVGIPFEEIEITRDSSEQWGVMRTFWEVTPWRYRKPTDLQRLFITLAGPAAEKHMVPGYSWGAITLGGAGGDYRQAWEIAEQAVGKAYSGKLVYGVTRTARHFVRDRWDDIVRLGDALIVAPDFPLLKYDECRVILGMRPSWQEPTHPEVLAALAAQTSAGIAAA